MKFDLYTKAVLSVIAVLLAVNLSANYNPFPAKSAQAAPAAFLQVGKNYNFIFDNDSYEVGKVVNIEANGWVKINKFFQETNQSGDIYINSDLCKSVYPKNDSK